MAFKYKTETYDSTAPVDTEDMGLAVEDMKMTAKNRRRIFERRWYDNNFFDDGFHFRYLSRSSNKIVDLSERSTIYSPQRAIPKASRQIRGIVNLLISGDPTPSVYPEPVDKDKIPETIMQNGQPVPNPLYQRAKEIMGEMAQKRGKWLEYEWTKDDGSGETVLDKIAFMLLLTMKHGISFMQVWPDEVEEEIKTQVYDAFDIYILGNYTNIYDCPFIIKSFPRLISEIKANPLFDPEQTKKLTVDNKKASSEIKEAYLNSRFGKDTSADASATIILNEAFVKENINELNLKRIKAQDDADIITKKRHIGSPIIRHIFTAGGVWLYDKYTNLSEYPFVDFRIEPGPLYQVPQIERFMPQNKSLDSVVSRLERYTHTMVAGMWLKHRGEQFKVNNLAGGQVIEYDNIKPEQLQVAPVPEFVSYFINLLTTYIEEQGVTTSTVGKIPSGITANAAIESLKESEYANLITATRRMKSMLQRLARKFLEIADENYITPKEVSYKDKGEVINFSVIGKRAVEERRKLRIETPYQVISLDKDTPVDIEIEQGMAYTKEGKKATIQMVMNTMIQLLQAQAIPPQALQVVAEKYLESYQFGSTQDFMEEMNKALEGAPNLSQQQITQMKIAILQALQEAGEIGPEGDKAKTQAAALGSLQALKDSGVIQPKAKESISISYKDAPEDVKRQMEIAAGFRPATSISPVATDQMLKHAKIIAEVQKAKSSENVARINK